MTSDVLIRPATLDDRSFIIDSWLRSYRNSEFGRRIPDDVWGTRWGHAGFIEDALSGWTDVACLGSDPAFLFGFSCTGVVPAPPQVQDEFTDPDRKPLPWPILHYVYVKRDFRRQGIGRLLVTDAGAALVTAETPAWKGFAAKHGIAYEYRHPYRKDR